MLISIDQVHLSKTNNENSGTLFKVYCPGQYQSFPHKLTMYNNGSVSSKVRYQDICTDRFVANIAHARSNDVVNNSMVEYPLYIIEGEWSYIPWHFEIIGSFLFNFNIIVNRWIDCNNTHGTLDYETGKWTGAVRQVNIELQVCYIRISNSRLKLKRQI